jgi:hypothetical protein
LSEARKSRRKLGAWIGATLLVALTAAAGTTIARSRADVAAQSAALALPRGGPNPQHAGAAAPSPTPAGPPGTTERISTAADGTAGNGASGGASSILSSAKPNQAISADGRWVAFVSTATNLIAGTPSPTGGICLRDRQSGTTMAIPWVDGRAFPAGITAAEPTVSGDGGVVAFTVVVTAGSPGGIVNPTTTPYVLAWDRQTNVTTVVSLDGQGQPTAGWQPSISADGRYVAYTQWAPADRTPPVLSNLTANPTGLQYLPCGPETSTISVTVTDPDDAVSAVTLFYAPNGGSTTSQTMSPIGSSVWQSTITLGTAWSTGQITYWVQATDSHGNSSAALFPSSSNILSLFDCIV